MPRDGVISRQGRQTHFVPSASFVAHASQTERCAVAGVQACVCENRAGQSESGVPPISTTGRDVITPNFVSRLVNRPLYNPEFTCSRAFAPFLPRVLTSRQLCPLAGSPLITLSRSCGRFAADDRSVDEIHTKKDSRREQKRMPAGCDPNQVTQTNPSTFARAKLRTAKRGRGAELHPYPSARHNPCALTDRRQPAPQTVSSSVTSCRSGSRWSLLPGATLRWALSGWAGWCCSCRSTEQTPSRQL